MGGYYGNPYAKSSVSEWKDPIKNLVATFFNRGDRGDLFLAYKMALASKTAGFIQSLLNHHECGRPPKEFSEFEYEIKFNVALVPPQDMEGVEPSMQKTFEAFELPIAHPSRFLKDNLQLFSESTNHFFGSKDEEALVVIERAEGQYLKEKSPPIPLNVGVEWESWVMKRSEVRYKASLKEVLSKVASVCAKGAAYQGCIRKEKADAYILDTVFGRIFSLTYNQSHLEGRPMQRQLELEYAGFVPGFVDFLEANEEQMVLSLTELARYIALVHQNTPLEGGWRLKLIPSWERKYDFVCSGKSGSLYSVPSLKPFVVSGNDVG